MARIRQRWRNNRRIVVVTGLPRSGTSMLMRMLVAGGRRALTDDSRQADDDNPGGYYEYASVESLPIDDDRRWLRAGRGRAVKVFSQFLPALPDEHRYAVIFIQRDCAAIVASQNGILQRHSERILLSDQAAIDLYQQHLKATREFLHGKANVDLLEVHYQDALDNPQVFAEQVNRFLGGRLKVAAMAGVVDA